MEELLKLFEENPELGHEVEVMWARGASAREVADMLSGKGVSVDVTQIEELLVAMQAKRAEAIGGGEKVDVDQLKAVAGGWCAFWQSNQGDSDTCSNRFKLESYAGADKCLKTHCCDSMWYESLHYCAFSTN